MPLLHGVQEEALVLLKALLNVFAGHIWGSELFEGQKLPAGHCWHWVEEDSPPLPPHVPAAQGMQSEMDVAAAVELYVPAGHALQ